MNNQRTQEDTVRSLAGIQIGDILEPDTLETVRERINSSGLFADTNVWWEQHGAGVRVNIAVKDKFPWAPVPTATWSANNKSLGLVFVHGNLFGRGKQFLMGARLASVDSGATLVYRDPAMFGSWVYWQFLGMAQRQIIPEFDNVAAPENPFRETRLTSYGVEPAIGVAWFRRVKTQVAWRLEKVTIAGSTDPTTDLPVENAARGALVGVGRAVLTFDFRAREFAVMRGTALSGALDVAGSVFKSDLSFWRAGASFEQGIRFFKTHNLVYVVGASAGSNLPFWNENTAGGPNLRGYLYQQFRGDTQLSGKVEYHFPLFSVGSADFRALGFYDSSAIWFRNLPNMFTAGGTYRIRDTPDQRTYPTQIEQGFNSKRDVHTAVGGGLRFFLRSVAIPLMGFDAGYGLESKTWRFFVIVGA